jgi:CopG-like RHH_1 or ribbon-helix-helix domain, RHH_5
VKRTTVFLTEEQREALARIARKRGFAVAQLIRVYVSDGLRRDGVKK